jgi:hypothetical protein
MGFTLTWNAGPKTFTHTTLIWTLILVDPMVQPNPNLHKPHTSKPYLHAYINTSKKSTFSKYHDFQLQMDMQLKIAIVT